MLNADDFPAYLVVYRAVHFVRKDKWFISTPSWCKSHDFNGIPPEKPVRLPFVPTTLWQGMMIEIPYGQVVTYGYLARQIAVQRGIESMSAQAVGGAVGRNPISII